MIEPRGRRLDPLQPALLHDTIQIDRHFVVAAKNIAVKKFLGNTPPPSTTSALRRGLNLINVLRLGGVAEDDSHGNLGCRNSDLEIETTDVAIRLSSLTVDRREAAEVVQWSTVFHSAHKMECSSTC